MKKQQGFTLIELVIVIVILGILAVTAAPKFLNLAGDAKAGTLNAVKASLQSANAEIYGKAILQNQQAAADGTLVNPAVTTAFGYAKATEDNLKLMLDVPDFEFQEGVDNTDLKIVKATDMLVLPSDSPAIDGNSKTACALVYRQAAEAGAKPTYTVINTGC